MSNMNRRSFVGFGASTLAVLGLGLTACGAGGGQKKIGVLQLVEHPALDAANAGFVEALDKAGIDYTIDQQNAQGDQSACQTIAAKLVNDGNDLLLAIATQAAQALAGATTDIPILATAITDFVGAELVTDDKKPGGNVSGVSDLTPVAKQFDMIPKLFPEAKKVGILFCSAEANSEIQAKLAEEAGKKLGLDCERYTVSNSNEIQQVVESMVSKVDVVYAPTDNVIASGMATVGMITAEHKLPVICGEEGMVNAGGLASYSFDYHDLGYKTGEMAVKILKGEAQVGDMPIEYPDESKLKLVVNDEVAKQLGVDTSVLEG